jgi:hypothetical protein
MAQLVPRQTASGGGSWLLCSWLPSAGPTFWAANATFLVTGCMMIILNQQLGYYRANSPFSFFAGLAQYTGMLLGGLCWLKARGGPVLPRFHARLVRVLAPRGGGRSHRSHMLAGRPLTLRLKLF